MTGSLGGSLNADRAEFQLSKMEVRGQNANSSPWRSYFWDLC